MEKEEKVSSADAVIRGHMADGTMNSGEESVVSSTSSSTVSEDTEDQYTSGMTETGQTDDTLNMIGLLRKLLAVEVVLLKEKNRYRKPRVRVKRKQLTTTDEMMRGNSPTPATNETRSGSRSKTRSPLPRWRMTEWAGWWSRGGYRSSRYTKDRKGK